MDKKKTRLNGLGKKPGRLLFLRSGSFHSGEIPRESGKNEKEMDLQNALSRFYTDT